jgi:hypothetical protein
MIQRGARLDPDTGITVTVNSPSHIDAVDSQEIKTGAGTLAFTLGGRIPVGWLGGLGDDSTDNSTAIQAVIDILEASGGGEIYFPAGIYRIESQITQTAGYIHWKGDGHKSEIHSNPQLYGCNYPSHLHRQRLFYPLQREHFRPEISGGRR